MPLPIHHLSALCTSPARRLLVQWGLGILAMPASVFAQTAKPPSPANAWPQASLVPGGIARLSLGPAATRPKAQAGDVPLLVLGDAREWTALVGIALATEPGDYFVTVQTDGSPPRQVAYTVAAKQYVEQRLKVAPGTVDLSPENAARYERERAHLATVMATVSEPAPTALRMRVPTPGRRSSSFGLRRWRAASSTRATIFSTVTPCGWTTAAACSVCTATSAPST